MKYRPNRLSIEVIKERMQDSNLELLSTTYKNNNTHLQWKCKTCGYIFPRSWGKIQSSERCDSCAGKLPITIDSIKKYLVDNNIQFKLLSESYESNTSELWFQHTKESCNHKFPRSWRNLRRNHKCPNCEMKKEITIESIKKEVKDKPIRLLSTEYKNNDTDLEWECTLCGHVFPRDYAHIKRTTYCPGCAILNFDNIKELLTPIHIGVSSTNYVDKDTPLDVYCLKDGCDKTWTASYNQIMKGKQRCPDHYGIKKYTSENIRKQLLKDKRQIALLTDTCTVAKDKALWKCLTCGHVWETTVHSVLLTGTGCSPCSGNHTFTIEDVIRIVKEQNIPLEYVSGEYKNQDSILYWKCLNPQCGVVFPKSWRKIHHRDKGCLFCKPKDRKSANITNAEKNKVAWLKQQAFVYIIKCSDEHESFYKIGYTKNTPKYRIQAYPYKTEVLKIIKTNRYDGIYIESDLQDFHRMYAYTPLKKFGGYRECFSKLHIKE